MNLIMCVVVFQVSAATECFDTGAKNYSLEWAAQGSSFFDDWDFGETDYTNGAVRYVGREEARNESLTQVVDEFAILRAGPIEKDSNGARRKSLRLSSSKSFKYFLVAMKFSHTPFGCGVWPAFWSNGASGVWPTDGELDILEYWNHAKSEVSFHTAISETDGCKLDLAQVAKKGCPHFADVNNKFTPWYAGDCQTDYNEFPPRLGCAPTSDQHKLKTGEEYSNSPGVISAEWTEEYIKVFYIPEAQIPKDLESGAPQPDTWDDFIISYYPFAASEKAHPGSCPAAGRGVSAAQAFILNIELCGGRGSLEFPFMCNGPSLCRNHNYAGKGDCCTEYMTDKDKSDKAIAADAFFNISYIKVWQDKKRASKDSVIV